MARRIGHWGMRKTSRLLWVLSVMLLACGGATESDDPCLVLPSLRAPDALQPSPTSSCGEPVFGAAALELFDGFLGNVAAESASPTGAASARASRVSSTSVGRAWTATSSPEAMLLRATTSPAAALRCAKARSVRATSENIASLAHRAASIWKASSAAREAHPRSASAAETAVARWVALASTWAAGMRASARRGSPSAARAARTKSASGSPPAAVASARHGSARAPHATLPPIPAPQASTATTRPASASPSYSTSPSAAPRPAKEGAARRACRAIH
jgi:hypothetical protein